MPICPSSKGHTDRFLGKKGADGQFTESQRHEGSVTVIGQQRTVLIPTVADVGLAMRCPSASWHASTPLAPRARDIALSIQQHSGTWSRVHADLAAINGHDRDLADTARADLLTWLQQGAATSYGRPETDQADEIARFLATSKLSDRQRRKIAFVVGIRQPVSRAIQSCSVRLSDLG